MKKRIVVIGGGPGGYVAAIRAAQLGAEAHLAEKENLGGTCLNLGCIPTKALLHSAEVYHSLKTGSIHGVAAEGLRLDWAALMARKATVVKRLVQGVAGLLKANGVQVHKGKAVLEDAHTVRIEGEPQKLTADVIILALGSVPAQIPIPGVNLPGVVDSTGALSLPEVPKSLVIIGGGVIGAEFAALYSALGTKVAVVEMLPQILPTVDGQIAAKIRSRLAKDGVTFLTDAKVSEIKTAVTGLQAVVEQGDARQELSGQYVLVATGRKASIQDAGLDAAGVKTEKGKIPVNDHFATNISHIYAIGDCNAQMMLAHAASAQGAAAAEHALGHQAAYHQEIIPYCIYTSPEAAGVGLTEEAAKARGLDYKIGLFPLAANGKSLIEGGEDGLVKIIADKRYGAILGAHIYGPRATDMVAELALAMRAEATLDEIAATIHAHPTVSEAIAEAAMQADGQAIHWPPGVKIS